MGKRTGINRFFFFAKKLLQAANYYGNITKLLQNKYYKIITKLLQNYYKNNCYKIITKILQNYYGIITNKI